MILKKEPFIKKMVSMLMIGLISISIIMVFANYYFLKQINVNESVISEFIFIHIGMMLLMIIFQGLLFIYSYNSFFKKLEKISFSIDRMMDGDYATILNLDQEGILSRLESQFYQMGRRLQLNLENLYHEKENIKTLVTDLSHQIKTPLASIKMFHEILIEEPLEACATKEFLNQAKAEVEKLEWLSNALMKVSRMEVGMIHLKKEKRDIKDTIIEAVNGVYVKVLEKNIEIKMDIKSIMIHHDEKWTKEAIFNVLENAVKYTQKNGTMHIKMEKLETYMMIDVNDNGIGIPADEIQYIFKRFYRGKAKKVQRSEGSGIGLYLTRKILEEQGGSIVAFSRAGEGTTFRMILPLQNCKEDERDL
ncbi:MAG: HAMP domain-containing histidine kinase [Marinisporobacter sp.]|jgi:signal transduction histidine kinase|nr:HAMP domain-containing histidine kinase [Marinisporobacter sp.]